MTAKRYREKPVVIEAVQWDGTGAHAGYITGWIANHGHEVVYCPDMPPDRAALRDLLSDKTSDEKRTLKTEKRPADLGGMQAGRKSPGRDFT